MIRPLFIRARSAHQLVEAIKGFRTGIETTQTELGRLSNLPQTSISKIEAHKIDPTLTTIFKILEALDLELVLQPKQKKDHQNIVHTRENTIDV